jgi:energy-coupling factor transporter ATP-binding protein EcfA2
LEEVLAALESFLHLLVAVRVRRRRFVRAAVVGWRDNAILILGPPASGKSTLLGALLRAGAAYYSDRYAVLEGKGRVHPYPTPLPAGLHLAPGGGKDSGGKFEVKRATRPLPVGLVLETRYDAGASGRLRRLSPGESLFALLRYAVDTRLRPEAALAYLHAVAARATALRGRRGEAAEAAAALLKQLGGPLRAGKNGR